MPRNVYFSQGYKQEQNTFEDLTIEALRIYGQEVYYLPRSILTRDMILNEDVDSQFDDAYMIEMYPEDIEGFGGEGNLMAKFGLEIRDEVTFVVAKRRFEKLVGFWNNALNNVRPNEGDLIYLPMSNTFFEISFVEHEQPFYQLNNLPVYKLQCRVYEYNDEDFNTGMPEIDQIETANADTLTMIIRNITGDLELGTRLYQAIDRDVNGDVTKWISGKITELDYISGTATEMQLTDFEINDSTISNFYISTVSDLTTYLVDNFDAPTLSASIYEIYDLDDNVNETFANDPDAQNWTFEQEANDIIDFSENNPFGEPD